MKDCCKKIDKFFEDIFAKAPALPKNAREWIVKIAPWLALIFGIMAVPGLLFVFGIGTVTSPFWAFRGFKGVEALIGFILSAAQVVMELMAVSPLFKRAMRGWTLLLYSSLLSVVSSVLHFSGMGILVAGINLYLLYQIKSYYK